MRPLFLAAARPMKVEWKISPYLGVFPRVFRALEPAEASGESPGPRAPQAEPLLLPQPWCWLTGSAPGAASQLPAHRTANLQAKPWAEPPGAPGTPCWARRRAAVVAQGLGLADHTQPRQRGPGASHPAAQEPAITATTLQRYLNRAFSAPRICTVEAGYLARFVRLPACEMRRAPTCEEWGRGQGCPCPTAPRQQDGAARSPRAGISSERCQQHSSVD